jgi:hypothetical protein
MIPQSLIASVKKLNGFMNYALWQATIKYLLKGAAPFTMHIPYLFLFILHVKQSVAISATFS